MTELVGDIQARIGAIRRKEPGASWPDLETLIEDNIGAICRDFDLRWLASICDTYADFGDEVERRNAMLISVIVNMEKMGQTYAHWRLQYPGGLNQPANDLHRKIKLPAGMTSFHLDIGDASNNMFGRLETLLTATPVLSDILIAVKRRLAENDTILGNLNRRHGHVFENDYSWILGDEYECYRSSGRIPPHRYEKYQS